MRNGDRVTEMYAFLTIDPKDDCEGIPAFTSPGGLMMPMVCADKERVTALRPIAESMARHGNCKLRLVRFHAIETLEEIL